MISLNKKRKSIKTTITRPLNAKEKQYLNSFINQLKGIIFLSKQFKRNPLKPLIPLLSSSERFIYYPIHKYHYEYKDQQFKQ